MTVEDILGKEVSKSQIAEFYYAYHHLYGVSDSDVELANYLKKKIEERIIDNPVPRKGDIIICKGHKAVYPNGQLDKDDPTEWSSICTQPYVPFVSVSDCGTKLFLSTSGGYWFSANSVDELKFVKRKVKQFKTWGHNGPCGDGAFYFPAVVNAWELFSEDVY